MLPFCAEKGCWFLPNMEKKSAEFLGEGGMGPIHAEHYHFDCFDAVYRGGGGEREKREPRVSSNAAWDV